jgi:DNA-binding NarL/FixJ family response regulator
VHIGFYEVLQANFPELTQNDLKLCAFLRLGLATKEIGELTNQRIETIEHSRYRLRKKLGIGNTDTNLVVFLSQFGIKPKQE